MRAVRYDGTGLYLSDIPAPVAGPGQVVLEVTAAGLHGRSAVFIYSPDKLLAAETAPYELALLDLELRPANTDDRAGVLPMLPRLAELGFEGDLLGDSGFKGAPFATAALEHDLHVSISPGGTRDGHFLPNGIRWVVERLFAWMSRHRRLNIVYDRAPELFAAHIWIAMISIISRRLVAQTRPQ